MGDDGVNQFVFASNMWAGCIPQSERIFINLKDLETEDPDQLVICEFKGKDFELVAWFSIVRPFILNG